MTAGPPNLTAEDRAAINDILARGRILECGGRTWEGPYNTGSPVYRLVDGRRTVPARRLVKSLKHEAETGDFPWAKTPLYSEHWECIDHVTTNPHRAAKPPPEPPPDPPSQPGYVRLTAPHHPIATSAGLVLEHRAVLHAKLGDGPQPCHYCGLQLRWEARRGEPDELTVEHLNGRRDDNRPDNLVPSCRPHNAARLHATGGWTGGSRRDGEDGCTIPVPSSPTSPDQEGRFAPSEPSAPSQIEQEQGWLGRMRMSAAFDRALNRVRDDRRLRVALVLVGLAFVAWFGSAWLIGPGLSAVTPDVRTNPGRTDPTTDGTVTTTAPLVAIGETPVPTSATPREPSTTTWWTMPPPCTPSSCPSLDD